PVLVAALRERVGCVEGFLLQLLEARDRGRGAGRAGLDGVAKRGGLVAESEERLARLVGGLRRLALPAAGLRQRLRERRAGAVHVSERLLHAVRVLLDGRRHAAHALAGGLLELA